MKKEPNTTIGEEHPKREVEVLVSLKQSEDDGESSETWDDKVLRVPVDLSVCSFSQRILSAFWYGPYNLLDVIADLKSLDK